MAETTPLVPLLKGDGSVSNDLIFAPGRNPPLRKGEFWSPPYEGGDQGRSYLVAETTPCGPPSEGERIGIK